MSSDAHSSQPPSSIAIEAKVTSKLVTTAVISQPAPPYEGRQVVAALPASREGSLAPTECRSGAPLLPAADNLPSPLRRYTLLAVFSLAQFFDVYLSSATIIAVSTISLDLKLAPAESAWLINSYTLTLAAFLLAAGRVSDMYSAKWTFVLGFTWVAIFSLAIGFAQDKTTVIVLRAMSGIGASATIPAALNLIVNLFPNDKERSRAISIFVSTGAIANVLGLVLGAVLLLAGWRWIFFVVTAVGLPGAILAAVLIPSGSKQSSSIEDELELQETATVVCATSCPAHPAAATTVVCRQPRMDYLGLTLLTAAIVCIIYGLSDGNAHGFGRFDALVPLVVGLILVPIFFYWQTLIDPIDALIDPTTWSIPNFTLLTILSLYFWWFLPQTIIADTYQREYATSAIATAAYLLPNGIASGIVIVFHQSLPKRFTLKMRIVAGAAGASAGALMIAFASTKALYWPLVFPGLTLGSASLSLAFVSINVALVLSVPRRHAGVAGGVFNSALQLGVSVGLAISTAIQVSFPTASDHAGADAAVVVPSWKGYQASLLFSVALTLAIVGLTLVFFREPGTSLALGEGDSQSCDLTTKCPKLAAGED